MPIIAIEGTDGSGKQTQVNLLCDRFQRQGRECAVFSFPQYGKKSAGLVEEYLNGKYGGPDEVDPYTASLFFALDRFDSAKDIREQLVKGCVVLLDRYVDSNVGHQGGKISDERARNAYVDWLYNLEYGILKNPRPDRTFVLSVPPRIGQELISKKTQREYIEHGKKQDIHEENLGHLEQAKKAFFWLVKKFPDTHRLINCYTDRLLSIEEIHEALWSDIHHDVCITK